MADAEWKALGYGGRAENPKDAGISSPSGAQLQFHEVHCRRTLSTALWGENVLIGY